MTVNYDAISGPSGYLASLKPFQGNTLFAFLAPIDDGTKVYTVISYTTVIATVFIDENELVEHVSFNDGEYSNTTSRHQALIHQWLPPVSEDAQSHFEYVN